MDYQPVIIVGAPRSGTNMLRDALCHLPGLGTWPCDEINYIWRYGNPNWPTDELPPELATPHVARYVESHFSRLSQSARLSIVVEKTCANSLRLPYVDAVLPNARYIWIHRDPADCVVSALKRWHAPMEWGYTLRKTRFVPIRDIPSYGLRFVRNRIHRLSSDQGRVASWGPVFDGMTEHMAKRSLTEVCAMQWSACIEHTAATLRIMAPDKWTAVGYEKFVQDPTGQMAALCSFLDLSIEDGEITTAIGDVSPRNVGNGRHALDADEAKVIDDIVSPAVSALQSLCGSSTT